MKYCLIANLVMTTPAKQDSLFKEFQAKIGGKKVWGDVAWGKGKTEDGKPALNAEVRFDNELDMDEAFAFLKDKMSRIPVLGGVISKHPCPHDEGGQPCVVTERFEI